MEKEDHKEAKKENKVKSNKKIVVIVISIILCLILAIISYSLAFNIRFNNKLKSSQDGKIFLNNNTKILVLDNKNKRIINEGDKKYIIYNDKYEYVINKINNFNYIDIENYDKEFEFNDEKINSYVLKLGKNTSKYITENITVILPEYLREKKNVDIYKYESGNLNLYQKSAEVDNGKVKVNVDITVDEAYFVITYIPLKDITVENDKLVMNKLQDLELNYKLYPENATDVAITCSSSSNIVDINGNKISGKQAGDTVITLSNGSIEKNIDLKINEVVSDILLSSNSVILTPGQSVTIKATPIPENASNTQLEWSSDNENIATVENGKITLHTSGTCNITVKTKSEPIISKVISVSNEKIYPAPEKYNVPGITYVDGILVANKKYSLPADFAPGVNQTALMAFNDMKVAAANEGINLNIISSYRSYSLQAGLYQKYVKLYGEDYASVISAKPGTSEHQTGLAFDICSLEESFADTKEGKWLAKNCDRFGFIIRYVKGKENITGYIYEPWHIRYLGTKKAQEVTKSGLCLEEFLNIQ